tara:strand:+ start:487 stop:1125 length:639 start_codon:yes stop_codon:yes gene_type:complete
MSWWPRSLGWRLAIAFACSVTAIGVLATLVEHIDTPPKATKRARPAIAETGAEPAASNAPGAGASDPSASLQTATQQLSKRSPSAPATLARALGFRLRATPGTIALAFRESSLPPDIAPVVEILVSGEVVLRRPMAVASGPGQTAPLSSQGHGAAVILPVRNLDLLSPAARAALIGLLQLWLSDRPVLPTKLLSNDLQLRPDAVRRLLSWVP